MQQAKFVFIAFFTLLSLTITLHSSIVTYIEQQYHNFTESHSLFARTLGDVYQASFLKPYAIFALSDEVMRDLEQQRVRIFTFNNAFDSAPLPLDDEDIESTLTNNLPDSKTPTMPAIAQAPQTTPEPTIPQPTIVESTTESKPLNPTDSNATESSAVQSPRTESKPIESKDTPEPANAQKPAEKSPENPPQKSIEESYTPLRAINNPRISIMEGSSVLLIGDSMMQGVAPYILKGFKKLNLTGINLSKHSTGLTYKHYFDWEAATKDAFMNNPQIALVVVLLGANDPWTMKKHIAFKSARWEEIYTQRISEIIAVAKAHNARVVWYEVPSVREKSLNDKILYLNSLYEHTLKNNGEYFLQTNGIITQGGKYSAFIKNAKNKSVQVRIDDGVHFTARGYQIMANIFLNALVIEPASTDSAPIDSMNTESKSVDFINTESAIESTQGTAIQSRAQGKMQGKDYALMHFALNRAE